MKRSGEAAIAEGSAASASVVGASQAAASASGSIAIIRAGESAVRIAFEHRQAAHCETGVTSNLMRFHGRRVSEPLVLGIGSGLFFTYLPFLKVNGGPGLSYRPMPGQIFARTAKRLGMGIVRRRFKTPNEAMRALDEQLAQGNPVACQVGVYNLPFFPAAYRFHFNAPNLVCFGKEDGKNLISDPIMESAQRLTEEEFVRVRFAQGVFAPRGHMYYLVPTGAAQPDVREAVRKGIRQNAQWMTLFFPLFGVRGIRTLARGMRRWPSRLGERVAALYLGQVIRMQEEIGTGGAGFRFMYAAFLQEAAPLLGEASLLDASKEMTSIGDEWRDFALTAARIYKKRQDPKDTYAAVSGMLMR
ncbi:MAG: BtrH N-terminal domain-containing protein, partial [Myxococcaceae bacterium]